MRQVTHALLTRPPLSHKTIIPEGNQVECFVRLACVKHAASVHPEPGSNSHVKVCHSWRFRFVPNLLFKGSNLYDWTFVNSFELLEYSHLNLSRFFTVQLSMFFCVASVRQRLDYFIRYSVVCQQLFSFIFRCFVSNSATNIWYITISLVVCQQLFIFRLLSSLKHFQRTLSFYQSHL